MLAALDTFHFTADSTAPTVVSSDPVTNATAGVNKVINVTFSEPIKSGNGWFELKDSNGTDTPITKSINGKVLTITPNNALVDGMNYNMIIHTGSVTDLAGNNVSLYTFHFTADGTAPTVVSMDPANSMTLLNKNITVTFSEPVKTGTGWVELFKDSNGLVPVTTSVNGNVLTITPNSTLVDGMKYTYRHTYWLCYGFSRK